MDGYTLTALLRKTRRRYGLSAASQALFHELVAIANEEGWPDTFKCSNGELENNLRISENTLKAVRNELIQCGLIKYKSGKSKREYSDYWLTTSKFDVKADTNTAPKVTPNTASVPAPNPADSNKPKPLIIEYAAALVFFLQTRNCREMREKYKVDIEQKFKQFYNEKVDLGEFDNKTREDLVRHFRNWLPKNLMIETEQKAKEDAVKKQKQAEGEVYVQPQRRQR